MKLGFLTPYSEDIVAFASNNGFECLELSGPPAEWLGDSDAARMAREEARECLDVYGVEVASFLIGFPSIRTPETEMPAALERLGQVFDVCKEMDGAVATGAGPMGYDPTKSLEENVEMYKAVYTLVGELAAEKDVKIGFENWPGGRGPYGEGGNLAVTPRAWEMMFEAVPCENIGLEFDPSHLMWQWIEPLEILDRFISRIHMVHAKDTQIYRERLNMSGVYPDGRAGWWRYRLPGFASFDWEALFRRLYELGYEGNVVIEHEDGTFSGDRRLEGFRLSGNYLHRCMYTNRCCCGSC